MKKIVIGISSSISAYKTADLCSKLKKINYDVTVIMSENAKKIISPLTFQSLTGNKVYSNLFSEDNTQIDHINLIKNADLFIIVPATANILAKAASGIADDFLSTSILVSSPNKTIFAPAMNSRMYLNPITQKNISFLKNLGYDFISPKEGHLACGEVGIGKLEDIDIIFNTILDKIENRILKNDKNILITAGGTIEKIDLVRYIGNHSSGKMGFELAKAYIKKGFNVFLIGANTNLDIPIGIKEFIKVETADEMFEAVNKLKDDMDSIIMCAAVSDFKVKNKYKQKIKKENFTNMNLELELNIDILKFLGNIENRKFKLIGFAAESENILENAKNKIKNKNLDYIILNDISKKEIGFNSDYNEVYIIDKNLEILKLNYDNKKNIAMKIADTIKLD